VADLQTDDLSFAIDTSSAQSSAPTWLHVLGVSLQQSIPPLALVYFLLHLPRVRASLLIMSAAQQRRTSPDYNLLDTRQDSRKDTNSFL
jgi:hypothetical protein